MEGTNSRLDTLQAAVLSVKLKYLQRWNGRRTQIANLYTDAFRNISSIVAPAVRENTIHTFHIYAIRCQQRNALQSFLTSQGINTMVHYPKGMPYTKAYRHFYHTEQDFPVTVQVQAELLSLPIFPELQDKEVTHITSNIINYFSR
jgi:dTDP-4-amino-4,6-dideoxygalactose transaminase